MLYILEESPSGGEHYLLGVFSSLKKAIEAAREIYEHGFHRRGFTEISFPYFMEVRVLPPVDTILEWHMDIIWTKEIRRCEGKESWHVLHFPKFHPEAIVDEAMALGEDFINAAPHEED